MSSPSWAEQQGIKVGNLGDRVQAHVGKTTIHVCEETRATTYEYRRAGIETLQTILHNNYLSKGVDAILYGISGPQIKYAIFVESGFLCEVEPD